MMKRINSNKKLRLLFIILQFLLIPSACMAHSSRSGWKSREVNWRMNGRNRIKSISYPAEKRPPFLKDHTTTSVRVEKRQLPQHAVRRIEELQQEVVETTVMVNVVNSPPVAGLVPWVALGITDAHGDIYEMDAAVSPVVTGDFLTPSPESNYAIAIFDTGASSNLINYSDAAITGLYASDMVTSSPVVLQGASGRSVTAYASFPLGLFADGLDAIEPNGLVDPSGMRGETNVSLIVGDQFESPLVPTVIGAPFAIFYNVAFCNNKAVSVNIAGQDVNSPHIDFYEPSDPCVPYYDNKIYMNLRPSDLIGVQYFPCIEPLFICPDGDGSPLIPTIIVDAWWLHQGLFFLDSVDVSDGVKSAIDKDAFMFDSGAQVSVISEAIAARLQLDIDNPEFTVEILDVTGDVSINPGFYLDSLEIVSSPEWLSYNNVPVIVLDIEFPGVGFIDGIIGTNLLVDFNFTFHGGGLPGTGAPYLRYEPVCDLPGDIAGDCYECQVDYLDLADFVEAWLGSSSGPSENWNFQADLAPQSEPDGEINFLDFAVLAQHWLEGTY